MVTGKPALVVYARGGEYPAGSPMEGYDMQKKYMDIALGFMGFTNVKSIIVEPTLAGPDVEAVKKTAAIAEARKLAENF
jgi:FMN-dependent NADH-azoreductase